MDARIFFFVSVAMALAAGAVPAAPSSGSAPFAPSMPSFTGMGQAIPIMEGEAVSAARAWNDAMGSFGGAARVPLVRRQMEIPDNADFLAADPDSGDVHAFDQAGDDLGILADNTVVSLDDEDNDIETRAFADFGARAGPRRMARASFGLEARAGKGCTAMDAATVQTIPAWDKVVAIANERWGTGRRNIATNEKKWPQYPAVVCVDTKPVDIAINGKPQCRKHTQTANGVFNGTSGYVEISVTTGTDYKLETTTTKQTTFGIGVTYSAKFEIPAVAEIGGSTTLSSQISNSLGETTSSAANQQVTTKINAQHKDGQTCKVDLDVSECTTHGSAQVPFLAKGFVWFEYEDKVQGHYLWAVRVDHVLQEKERSLFMEVDSVVGSETKASYGAVCSPP
ncbi:hypothetical protein HDZ31DRAFT_63006 [Schizophyllum fasciatum]